MGTHLLPLKTWLATAAAIVYGLAGAAELAAADTAPGLITGVMPLLTATADVDVEQPQPESGPPHDAVPVLMYHVIAPGPNALYVPPDELDAHLRLLSEHGFTTISLADLADHFAYGTALPERPIVLTFDDGYESAYTAALPLLQQYGMTGTFFIITGLVGQPGYVTWEQVAALAAAGMEIGAHTVSHPDLRGLAEAAVHAEVADSGQRLADALGSAVTVFAYPAGSFNQSVVAAVGQYYRAAVTTLPGAATPCQDPLLWHRIRVNQGMPAEAVLDAIDYWQRQPSCP